MARHSIYLQCRDDKEFARFCRIVTKLGYDEKAPALRRMFIMMEQLQSGVIQDELLIKFIEGAKTLKISGLKGQEKKD